MDDARRQPAPRLDRPSLAEVAELAADCRLCRLCHTRTHVVFGSGNESADLMFVAEGPGYHEDRSGSALVGDAGELFDELLASIELVRQDVYLTSVVKCRPPRNRSPFPDEIEQCEGYLFREVSLVQPRVIAAFGNVAIRLLTGRPHQLSDAHGQPVHIAMRGREVIVLPLFHPAAALQSTRLVATLRQEFRLLPRLLSGEPDTAVGHPPVEANPAASAAAAGPGTLVDQAVIEADADAELQQLSLNLG